MANVDAPFGFRPVKSLNGHPWNGQSMRCWVNSTDASAMYIGDAVVWSGTACTNGCCPDVNFVALTDGLKWLGPIVGIDPTVATSLVYRAASTERYLQVCVDPDMIYEVQSDGTNAITDVGQNAIAVTTHAGSTITGLSGMEMNNSVGANASYPLLLIGAVDREDNDISSANANWLVLNNLHSFKACNAAGGGAAEGVLGV